MRMINTESRLRNIINFEDYKTISRTSNTSEILAVLAETYDTTRALADAVKYEQPHSVLRGSVDAA